MKCLWIVFAVLCVVALLAYIIMAMQSQKLSETLGLQEGKLRPCPDSPNCVCSEAHSQASQEHAIAAIKATDDTWQQLRKNMLQQGGTIEHDDGHYLHATFTSRIFRYVDDVELRRDADKGLIHIRSASRVGRSDFGINSKRVEQIKQGVWLQ